MFYLFKLHSQILTRNYELVEKTFIQLIAIFQEKIFDYKIPGAVSELDLYSLTIF